MTWRLLLGTTVSNHMKRTPLAQLNVCLPRPVAILGLYGAVSIFAGGCESGFQRIDRRTTELLATSSAALGADAIVPRTAQPSSVALDRGDRDLYREEVPTVNPTADELTFTPIDESDDTDTLMQRLQRYSELLPDAVRLDLRGALSYAIRNSREYRFAEEEYVLAGLQCIDVHLHRVGSVLQFVLDIGGPVRKFPWLPDGDEADPEPVRQGRSEDEPPSLRASQNIRVNAVGGAHLRDPVHHFAEARSIAQ